MPLQQLHKVRVLGEDNGVGCARSEEDVLVGCIA
jgi:hypothetical protein